MSNSISTKIPIAKSSYVNHRNMVSPLLLRRSILFRTRDNNDCIYNDGKLEEIILKKNFSDDSKLLCDRINSLKNYEKVKFKKSHNQENDYSQNRSYSFTSTNDKMLNNTIWKNSFENGRLNKEKSPCKDTSQKRNMTVYSNGKCHTGVPRNLENSLLYQDDDDDLDSLRSYASSLASTTSCDHANIAKNGTTYSGRKQKYVIHCPNYGGEDGEEYLTPTQRAQRQIKKLKLLLQQAKLELEQKDSEIFRLTREVVQLRLHKASLHDEGGSNTGSRSDSTGSNPMQTVCENTPVDTPSENSESVQKMLPQTFIEKRELVDEGSETDENLVNFENERRTLIDYYEKKLENLAMEFSKEEEQLKREQNEKVEALLKTLTEVNQRYSQLIPDYDEAKERIRELELQLDSLTKQLNDYENKQKEIYLEIYEKAPLAQDNDVSMTDSIDSCSTVDKRCVSPISGEISMMMHNNPAKSKLSRLSVSDLLYQLQITQNELENIRDLCSSSGHDQLIYSTHTLLSAKEAISLWVLGARKALYRRLVESRETNKTGMNDLDPEITLQFLKSAIYYFLTDKENFRGHLRAIESILGFNSDEINCIDRANNI